MLDAHNASTGDDKKVEIFYSYAQEDADLRNELEKHLTLLRRRGIIAQWHNRCIGSGSDWAASIDAHLTTAALILLLISPDFIASDYCYDREMMRALERHRAGEVRIIPIILRPVDWDASPFAHLQALPANGVALTLWKDRDEAFRDIARGIRTVVEQIVASVFLSSSASSTTPLAQKGHWNVPFPRNEFFTNREDVLLTLHKTLHSPATKPGIYALNGLGGVGKTQTAVEYAYRYRNDYHTVLWVAAEKQETLVSGVVALAELLDLPEKKAQDQRSTINAVRGWLQLHTNWLLILDNASNLPLVYDFIPSEASGHVLLTTQSQALGGRGRKGSVKVMPQEQGAQLLLRRAHLLDPTAELAAADEKHVAAAKVLCKELGGLPLALDQAGAYIEETACGLAEYLKLYLDKRDRRADLLKRRGGFMNDHPASVATTLALSFQKIARANPTAVELLSVCAFLYPDDIPEELIEQGAVELGAHIQSMANDTFALHRAYEELQKFSLLERDADKKSLKIHRLVQVVLKDSMDESERRRWAERVVRTIKRMLPDPRYFVNWDVCERYLPHARICADLIAQWGFHFAAAVQLLNRSGYYLMRRGHYLAADGFYQQALLVGQQFLAEDDPDFAETLFRQGELLYMQGKYSAADQLYQRALAIRERVLGAEHPDVALTLHNQALLYYELGRAASEREPLYQRALAIWEKTRGPEHPDVAECLNNLAGLYRSQGRYAPAEALLQRALAIREKAFGAENPDTVLSLHALAQVYLDQGKDVLAEPLLKRGLRMCERVLGSAHAYTAAYLSSLGQIAARKQHYAQAEQFYLQAIVVAENALGREHAYIMPYLTHLAVIYRAEQKYHEAEQLYLRVLRAQEQQLGTEHPNLAGILDKLVEVYQLAGNESAVEQYTQRALKLRQ